MPKNEMTKEAALRIHLYVDRTGQNKDFTSLAQCAADRKGKKISSRAKRRIYKLKLTFEKISMGDVVKIIRKYRDS